MKPSPESIARHPHLAEPVPDGWLRVDFHSHTMWSGDCTTTIDELTKAVGTAGIDVLCITDHNAIDGAFAAADALSEAGCRIVVGEEVRAGTGELIGLFLTERIPAGLGVETAAKRIRDQGGLVYIPHPFDPMRNCLSSAEIDALVEQGLVDGIEGQNSKTKLKSLNRRGVEYGRANDLFVGAGSDAHVPDALGASYVVMPEFLTATEFAAAVRRGRLVGHYFDTPRPWAPRIVPSVTDVSRHGPGSATR